MTLSTPIVHHVFSLNILGLNFTDFFIPGGYAEVVGLRQS